MSAGRNLLLIGQAQEIDLVQPQVRAMLNEPGIYIAGDTDRPDLAVVLVVQEPGRVSSLALDDELDPERFLPTLTLRGPYRHDDDPPAGPLSPADLRRAAGFLDGERDDQCVIQELEAKRLAKGLRAFAEAGGPGAGTMMQNRAGLVALADVALRELSRIHECLDDAIAKCELARAEPADGAQVAPIWKEVESMMSEFKASWPSDTSRSRRDRANVLCERFLRLRNHLRGWKGDTVLKEWSHGPGPAEAGAWRPIVYAHSLPLDRSGCSPPCAVLLPINITREGPFIRQGHWDSAVGEFVCHATGQLLRTAVAFIEPVWPTQSAADSEAENG